MAERQTYLSPVARILWPLSRSLLVTLCIAVLTLLLVNINGKECINIDRLLKLLNRTLVRLSLLKDLTNEVRLRWSIAISIGASKTRRPARLRPPSLPHNTCLRVVRPLTKNRSLFIRVRTQAAKVLFINPIVGALLSIDRLGVGLDRGAGLAAGGAGGVGRLLCRVPGIQGIFTGTGLLWSLDSIAPGPLLIVTPIKEGVGCRMGGIGPGGTIIDGPLAIIVPPIIGVGARLVKALRCIIR